jgi:hypothetical protein
VTGAEKAPMLNRLLNEDQAIPAGRIRVNEARVVADEASVAGVR